MLSTNFVELNTNLIELIKYKAVDIYWLSEPLLFQRRQKYISNGRNTMEITEHILIFFHLRTAKKRSY